MFGYVYPMFPVLADGGGASIKPIKPSLATGLVHIIYTVQNSVDSQYTVLTKHTCTQCKNYASYAALTHDVK